MDHHAFALCGKRIFLYHFMEELFMKHTLTIAGSDCSGGAGIQADLKTFSAHGCYGMSVIVSVVAENTSRVISIQNIEPQIIRDQIDAVFEDIPVHAVKVGMLSEAACMAATAESLEKWKPIWTVIDPVMIAKGGQALMEPASLEFYQSRIVPLADVLTPNIPEAECLTGLSIHNMDDMKIAAHKLHDIGAKNVLIKGGHAQGDATDLLFDGEEFHIFEQERIPTKNTHGTGCTFSSAIAANLANELPLLDAVKAAKRYITEAIRHALPIGHGHGPTHHFYAFDISSKNR